MNWIKKGLSGKVAVEKPLLKKGNRGESLSYAKLHKISTESQWQHVFLSDVSKLEIFRLSSHYYVWGKSTMNVYSHLQTFWRLCHGLGLYFS